MSSRSSRETRSYGAPTGITQPGKTTRERPKVGPGTEAALKEAIRASDEAAKAPPLRSTTKMPGEDGPALPQNSNPSGRRLPASQTSGTKDITVGTGISRLKNRGRQIDEAVGD